jgi:hypothetical protein
MILNWQQRKKNFNNQIKIKIMKKVDCYIVQGKADKGGDYCHKFKKEFTDKMTDAKLHKFYDNSFSKDIVDELIKVRNKAKTEAKTEAKITV